MKDIIEIREELKTLFQTSEKDDSFKVDQALVYAFLTDCRRLLTLDYIKKDYSCDDIEELLVKIRKKLRLVLSAYDWSDDVINEKVMIFLNEIPTMRRKLYGSMMAILDGDPASDSIEEIVTCYPGFLAILNYRIANVLYHLDARFIARIITEDAHRQTGIDINPGATIGERFFIDHGTGIVIGETAILGDDVKLYQGVTLGAKSLSKGRDLIGSKRHPTVGNKVTIYSNASILGGDSVIGDNTIVGANVYLTTSVPENSIVILTDSGIAIRRKESR